MSARCARMGRVCRTRRSGECLAWGAAPPAATASTGCAPSTSNAHVTTDSVPAGASAAPARSTARITNRPPASPASARPTAAPASGSAPTAPAGRTRAAAQTSGSVSTARAWPKASAVRTNGSAPTAAASHQAPAARGKGSALARRHAAVSMNAALTRSAATAAALTPMSTGAAATRSAGVIPCVATATVATLVCIVAVPPAVSTEGGEGCVDLTRPGSSRPSDGDPLHGHTRVRRLCGAPLPRVGRAWRVRSPCGHAYGHVGQLKTDDG
jgi:hypothetical protein